MRPRSIPQRLPAITRRALLGGAAALGGALLGGHGRLAAADCRPTESDILGPFYRFGAPFRSRLAEAGEPGDRLVVSGTVLSTDCRTPVPGALVEVWQANHAGVYDTNLPGNFTEVTTFHMRGMMYTNEQGHYEIETIMPGRYPVPPNLPGLEKYAGPDAARAHPLPRHRVAARSPHDAALLQGRPLHRRRSLRRPQVDARRRPKAGRAGPSRGVRHRALPGRVAGRLPPHTTSVDRRIA